MVRIVRRLMVGRDGGVHTSHLRPSVHIRGVRAIVPCASARAVIPPSLVLFLISLSLSRSSAPSPVRFLHAPLSRPRSGLRGPSRPREGLASGDRASEPQDGRAFLVEGRHWCSSCV